MAGANAKAPPATPAAPRILTIGHSTRPIEDFIAMLQAHGVKEIVDIRTIPRSRHNPQFNRENLPAALEQAGIGYIHMGGLGGLRHPRKDSRNTGWRNSGFRGFADYMETPEFRSALGELIEEAARSRVAIMCAEAVPWRCHRSLIADALTARAIPVEHIMDDANRHPHELTPFALVQGTEITYPADPDQQHLLFDETVPGG